jgi:hypothetical protein
MVVTCRDERLTSNKTLRLEAIYAALQGPSWVGTFCIPSIFQKYIQDQAVVAEMMRHKAGVLVTTRSWVVVAVMALSIRGGPTCRATVVAIAGSR